MRRLRSPTLLIVGAHHTHLVALHRAAQRTLRVTSALEILPSRMPPGQDAVGSVARLARCWFEGYLVAPLGAALRTPNESGRSSESR